DPHLGAGESGVLGGGVAHARQVARRDEVGCGHLGHEARREELRLAPARLGESGVALPLVAALEVPDRLSVSHEVHGDGGAHGVCSNQGRTTGTAASSARVYGSCGFSNSCAAVPSSTTTPRSSTSTRSQMCSMTERSCEMKR